MPRHAAIYMLCIGVTSMFQIALGANLLVLLAIDAVCLAAVWPMTRTNFDPTDLLYLSLCLYYGTFSLIFKTLVFQPVQMNLAVPYLTSAYLLGGFGMITLSYLFVGRVMTRHYPGTRLRTWTWLERAYADPAFLAAYTIPISLIALALTVVVALFSHSTLEIENGMASSGGLATLGSITALIQLALAMQLTMLKQRNNFYDRAIAYATITVGIVITLLNNQKLLTFQLAIVAAIFAIAYKIRIRPRIIIMVSAAVAIAFLYVTPLVHIVRSLGVEKSDRLTQTIQVLNEANYNPIDLLALEEKLTTKEAGQTIADQIDYLYPYNLKTDRFTQLMPIDQMARAEGRSPLGLAAYYSDLVDTTLPKFIVGDHAPYALDDQVAWRFSVRENNVISRPALGFMGTAYGVAGGWGILLLAPFVTLILFALVKFVCNGSIWQNPWAIFIASYIFFDGESDVSLINALLRSFIPLVIIAWGFAMLDKMLRGADRRRRSMRLSL